MLSRESLGVWGISNERLARVKDVRRFLEVAPELIVEVVSAKQSWKNLTGGAVLPGFRVPVAELFED